MKISKYKPKYRVVYKKYYINVFIDPVAVIGSLYFSTTSCVYGTVEYYGWGIVFYADSIYGEDVIEVYDFERT